MDEPPCAGGGKRKDVHLKTKTAKTSSKRPGELSGRKEKRRERNVAEFLNDLDARLKDDDKIWIIDSPLVYISDILGKITVPLGFETDFASVPRVPLFYTLFGDRAHRESVVHDMLYRMDALPTATRKQADKVFLEAMKCRGKSWFVRYPMYWGVRAGGLPSYHKRKIGDQL